MGNRLYCVNHADDFRSIDAMRGAGVEACGQLDQGVDLFVGACGNGASLLGIGTALKKACPGVQVISCDPAESPVSFARKYPMGTITAPEGGERNQHDVYGTGAWGIDFRFLRPPLFDETVDGVQLVTRAEREHCLGLLHKKERVNVGRSSGLVLAAALKLCEKVRDKTVLIVFYDAFDAYV